MDFLSVPTDKILPLGFSEKPPASPWGVNFGAGKDSSAVMFECRERGFRPDWCLFADTGSERPETYAHVERMRRWAAGWVDIITVRWERQEEPVGFEPLHVNCLRTSSFPSIAYGNAGCSTKWKAQPMEKWRREHGFDHGAFAVGYNADEHARIKKACLRGDDPNMIAWYPLVAWGIGRLGCEQAIRKAGAEFSVVGKSSCFMCPNMKEEEWIELREKHPRLLEMALEIERKARAAGERPADGRDRETPGFLFDPEIRARILARPTQGQESFLSGVIQDRCGHVGCMT